MQAMVSVGVNLGALPTKGLTLPLISSGGSSMLLTCVMAGVLLRAAYRNQSRRGRAADGHATLADRHAPCRARSPVTRTAAGRAGTGRTLFRGGARMSGDVQAPVLIMAGGTGGHIFPGLAVAGGLRAQRRAGAVAGRARRHGKPDRAGASTSRCIPCRSGACAARVSASASPRRGCWRARACRRGVRCATSVRAACCRWAVTWPAPAVSSRGCCGVRCWCTSRTASPDSPTACWRSWRGT